jgi:hypothetical protein
MPLLIEPLSCSPVCAKNLKDVKKDKKDLKDLPRLKAQVFETKDTELFEEIFEYRIPLFDFEKGRISHHFVSTRGSNWRPLRPV